MKKLFFDLDGTITESALGITRCVAYALEHYGIKEQPENLTAFVGPPLTESFTKYYGFTLEQGLEATDIFRERFSTIGKFENQVYTGVVEMLEKLQKDGFEMYIVTSKPEHFSIEIIEHFDLMKYFVRVYGEDFNGNHEKKYVVKRALDGTKFDPSDVYMIGDRSHDIIAGKENGVEGLGVLWGYGSKEELVDAGAKAAFETPNDLLEYLENTLL